MDVLERDSFGLDPKRGYTAEYQQTEEFEGSDLPELWKPK